MATLPNDTTELVPVGGLSYTASGMPYAADPNITEAEFLAALAQGPASTPAASIAMPNYLADARNAGLPENLRYTPTTYNLNPNYDPKAQFSLAPGSELTMSQQDIDNARILWQNQNQQYSPKSWMVNTDPTGYGGTHLNLQSGNPYVLRNNETGEIVAQGSDDATLEKIANLISSGSLGDKWQLFEPGQSSYGNLTAGMSPEDAAFAGNTGYGNSEYVEGKDGQPGYWLNPIGGAKPAPSTLGKIVGTALKAWGLPVAGAYLGPAIQAAQAGGATALGAGLAGAATGAAGSALSGGNILKGALLGGAASVGLGALSKALGPGAPSGGASSGGGGGGNTVPTSVDTSGIAPVGDIAPITVVGGVGVPTFAMSAGVFNQVPRSVDTTRLDNGRLPTSVDTTGINPIEFTAPNIDTSAADLGGGLTSADLNQIVVSGGSLAPGFTIPTGPLTTAAETAAVAPSSDQIKVTGQQTKDTATPPVGALTTATDAVTPPSDQIKVTGQQQTKTDTTAPPVGPLTTTADVAVPADKPLVEVTGEKQTDTSAVTLPASVTTSVGPSVPTSVNTNQIVVSHDPVNNNVISVPVNGLTTTSGSDVPTSVNTNEIVVKGDAKPDPNAAVTLPTNALTGDPIGTEGTKSTLDKVIDYLKAAGLGVGLLGNLGGGGGSGGSGTMPGGMGARSPIYSATLPTPGQNGAFAVGGLDRGTGAGGIGGVTPPGGDYTRFGMGSATRATPTAIPQYGGVNPPGFNTDTWEWLGPQTGVPKDITDQLAVLPSSAAPAEPVKKAMGGYAVGGPGDGRSDEIPAMLSDGEYVIDAETVALLGNGSNKAGAQQLDKFRANIRKHKGRELARGQFSVKAKAPDAYLPKGRS